MKSFSLVHKVPDSPTKGPAERAWADHQAVVARAVADSAQLGDRVRGLEAGALRQATETAAALQALRERRRNAMATAMLSDGPADTSGIDREIATVAASERVTADRADAAAQARAVLVARLSEHQTHIGRLRENEPRLLHDMLTERLATLAPEYLAAVDRLAALQTELGAIARLADFVGPHARRDQCASGRLLEVAVALPAVPAFEGLAAVRNLRAPIAARVTELAAEFNAAHLAR